MSRGWEEAWCLVSARGGEVAFWGSIMGSRKLPKRAYLPPRIKCRVANLSITFIKRSHLNNVFTASNPFYNLQQNLDRTSIKERVMGHPRGRS